MVHAEASSAATIKSTNGQSQEKLRCGEDNKVDVFFTSKQDSKVNIIWYMTSGGSIVKQGRQELEAGLEDKSEDYGGDAKSVKLGEYEDASESEVVINNYSFNVRPLLTKKLNHYFIGINPLVTIQLYADYI